MTDADEHAVKNDMNRQIASSLVENAEIAQNLTLKVNQLLKTAISCETTEAVATACLQICEEVTGSKFGFIGEINEKGLLDTMALSDPGFDACRMKNSDVPVLINDMEIRGIWSSVLRDETPLMVNEPNTHPDRVGTPEGHPPIKSFMGVPVKIEGKNKGIIALANKPGGYSIRDREAVETLSVPFLEALTRVRMREEIKRYVKELEHSNQELDDFAYIASHDLKEPLRGISNLIFFLMEDAADQLDEESRSRLERVQYLCSRMDRFISDLLTFSRVGRMDAAMTRTDLDELVQEVISENETIREQAVSILIKDRLPTVFCDRMRLGEVFSNLISNGIKYNDKPEKRIEIGCKTFDKSTQLRSRVKKTEDIPVIYVRDNGLGIEPQHTEKIFKIFKRLHARDKYGGGTGAGLTIVRKIIKHHGGKIWVESTSGEGSTFYFTLQGESHVD